MFVLFILKIPIKRIIIIVGTFKEVQRNMDYGKKLKSIRENKKISIYRLSQDTGISQGHISDLENGRNQPTIETLRKILVPLGITLAEFFNEDKDVSYLNERETKLLTQFRNMPDDKAELFLQLGKALSEH